eukprot:1117682-Pyramimonas_sp.AAC.1
MAHAAGDFGIPRAGRGRAGHAPWPGRRRRHHSRRPPSRRPPRGPRATAQHGAAMVGAMSLSAPVRRHRGPMAPGPHCLAAER